MEGELLSVGVEQQPSQLGLKSREGFNYLASALRGEDLLPTFSYILGSREVYVSRQEDVWLQLHLMNYDVATIAEFTDTEAIDIEVSLARLDEALAGIDWEDVLFEIVGAPKTVPEAAAVELEPTEAADALPPAVAQSEADYLDSNDEEAVAVEPPAANRDAVVSAPKPRRKVVRRIAVEPDPGPISDREFVPLGVRTLLELFQKDQDPTLSEEELETGWQRYANCAQTDPEAFFPEKGGSTRDAKKVCSRCDVRGECLDYALRHDERFGIWGGLSERERRKLKKRVI